MFVQNAQLACQVITVYTAQAWHWCDHLPTAGHSVKDVFSQQQIHPRSPSEHGVLTPAKGHDFRERKTCEIGSCKEADTGLIRGALLFPREMITD